MASINLQRGNGETSFPAQVWQAIIDLDFISHFTTWFFRFVSRVSELVILISSAYIATSAAITAIKIPFCFDASMIVLIAAPDFIGPGALATGVIKRRRQEEGAGLYITMGCVFCLLITAMILTTFVWKLDATGSNVLTGLRCLAGIAYGVLTRITEHKTEHTAPGITQAAPLTIEDLNGELTARLSAMKQDIIDDLAQRSLVQEVVITEEKTEQNTLPVHAVSLEKVERCEVKGGTQSEKVEQQKMERSTNKNTALKQERLNRVRELVEQGGTVSLAELHTATGYSKPALKRYLDEINGVKGGTPE
jgi:hypothetical protein